MQFKQAEKSKSKLRLAIYGLSGSGKTLSSLLVAQGLGGSIAVIDTEHGRASIYADRVQFQTIELEIKTIDKYIEAINLAAKHNFPVLIIDSLTHAWQELLEEVDKLSKTQKYRGNSFSAWREGTPKQKELVEAIMSYPGHVIATMRSATEWVLEKNSNDKNAPKKVGLKPEQGKGIEYEFNLLINIGADHVATIEKDNTGGDLQDLEISKPGIEFGEKLAVYLANGKPAKSNPAPTAAKKPAPVRETIPAPAQTVSIPESAEPEPLAPEPINEPIKPAISADRKAIIAQHIKRIAMGNVDDDYINQRIDEIGEEAYVSAWEHFGEEWKAAEINAAAKSLKLEAMNIVAALEQHGLKSIAEVPSEVVVDAITATLHKIRQQIDSVKTPPKTPAGIRVPNMGF